MRYSNTTLAVILTVSVIAAIGIGYAIVYYATANSDEQDVDPEWIKIGKEGEMVLNHNLIALDTETTYSGSTPTTKYTIEYDTKSSGTGDNNIQKFATMKFTLVVSESLKATEQTASVKMSLDHLLNEAELYDCGTKLWYKFNNSATWYDLTVVGKSNVTLGDVAIPAGSTDSDQQTIHFAASMTGTTITKEQLDKLSATTNPIIVTLETSLTDNWESIQVPKFSAPTVSGNLVIVGSTPVKLITQGSNTTAGTWSYKLSTDSTYTENIPEVSAAGNYSVDWKFTPTDTTTYKVMTGTISGITVTVEA